MYSFSKARNSFGLHEFRNQYFQRDNWLLVGKIKRKFVGKKQRDQSVKNHTIDTISEIDSSLHELKIVAFTEEIKKLRNEKVLLTQKIEELQQQKNEQTKLIQDIFTAVWGILKNNKEGGIKKIGETVCKELGAKAQNCFGESVKLSEILQRLFGYAKNSKNGFDGQMMEECKSNRDERDNLSEMLLERINNTERTIQRYPFLNTQALRCNQDGNDDGESESKTQQSPSESAVESKGGPSFLRMPFLGLAQPQSEIDRESGYDFQMPLNLLRNDSQRLDPEYQKVRLEDQIDQLVQEQGNPIVHKDSWDFKEEEND